MIRRIVFILVCLGLALQGSAVRALEQAPCPMESTMQALLATGDLERADLVADCCNDLQTFAATGQPCKSGADCNAPPVLSPASTPHAAAAIAASIAPLAGPPSVLSAPAATPWRPPTTN